MSLSQQKTARFQSENLIIAILVLPDDNQLERPAQLLLCKRSTAHLLQGQQIVAVVGLDLQRLRRTFD